MNSEAVKIMIPVIRQYFQEKPVKRVYLFGSYSRGEEDEKSDIDLLVTYDDSTFKNFQNNT